MKTRSKCSNHESGLSVTVYGGGGIVPSSRMTTRFGPRAPRCSQIDDEPGPPLNTKHTGRLAAALSARKYDVVNTAASGSPRFSSRPPAETGMNSAIASYFNVRPSMTMLPSLLRASCARSLSTFSRKRFFGSSLPVAGVGSLMEVCLSLACHECPYRVALFRDFEYAIVVSALAVDDHDFGKSALRAVPLGGPLRALRREDQIRLRRHEKNLRLDLLHIVAQVVELIRLRHVDHRIRV